MSAIARTTWKLFLLCLLSASTAGAALPDITAAELIEAVKRGDSLLMNVDCKYSVEEEFHKKHDKYGKPLKTKRPKRRLEIHWRKEGTKDYIDVTQHNGRLYSGKPFRIVTAYYNDGEGCKQWTPNVNSGNIPERPYKHAWPIPFDFCLTLKKRGKMLGQALEQAKIETIEEARWENRECYYVEAVQPDQGRAKVWIDPKAGWRARRIRYWGPNGTISYEASANLKDCGNGIWFPAEGVFKLYGNDPSTGKRIVSFESKLKVEQVKVNAELTIEDFEIQYPRGTSVYVAAHKASYIVGFTSLGGFGEETLRSLVGKPLPDMKGLGVALDSDQAKDKMVLVCLWDMSQRPSRHCIMQLAARAEHLKNEKVTVLTVQASKVDANMLNEWVKKNNIPFPVGMIEADEEEVRRAWGAESLPRLILTDYEHIVRSEGFAVAELDERIESVRDG